MEKLERQLGLLATLLHVDRHLTAADIQQTVEGYPSDKVAFRRAFERDKDDLRRLGVPLSVERTSSPAGEVDGYRVHRSEYYLHNLDLEPDEVVALSVALRLIDLEGASVEDTLWKLGGADSEPLGPQMAAITVGPAVAVVQQAIADRARVSFGYRQEQRTVDPWRLAFRRGQWYLHGFDTDRNAERQFRLDRFDAEIQVAEAGSASNELPATPEERQPWQFGSHDDDVVTAEMSIDASHAAWAEHHLGSDSITRRHDDGSIVVALQVSNTAAFRSLVLSFGTAAEVLGPQELRSDLISWLEGQTG